MRLRLTVLAATVPALVAATAAMAATINGTQGNDTIYGTGTEDTISAGAGADVVYGQGGDDDLRGNSDDDRLFGGLGNDRLAGGPGHDQMWGRAGNDHLNAQGWTEALTGGNYVDGGAGSDTFNTVNYHVDEFGNYSYGDDIINCGAGYDRAIVDKADESKRMTWQGSGCEWVSMHGVVIVNLPPPSS